MFRFEELEIWKLAVDYGKDCYKIAQSFPKSEQYGLTDQLKRAAASISTATNAELQPGQIATIYLELDETLKEGRDAQIKLTTANGAVFVGTVIAGQQSG